MDQHRATGEEAKARAEEEVPSSAVTPVLVSADGDTPPPPPPLDTIADGIPSAAASADAPTTTEPADVAPPRRPAYLLSLGALAARLTAHPHEVMVGGEYTGVLKQPTAHFPHTFTIVSADAPVYAVGEHSQMVHGRLQIEGCGEAEFSGPIQLRSGMFDLTMNSQPPNTPVADRYLGRLLYTSENNERRQHVLRFSGVTKPTGPLTAGAIPEFDCVLNECVLVQASPVHGCPLASQPVTTLALVCRFLGMTELMAVARASRLLAAAAAHPLTFAHGITTVVEFGGVRNRGPSAVFTDSVRLSAALQSQLLSHFKLMTLSSPYFDRPEGAAYIYRLMATLVRERQTSLYALTIESKAPSSFWLEQPREENDEDQRALFAQLYPLGKLPPRAMQIYTHRHPLRLVTKATIRCCECRSANGGIQHFSCLDKCYSVCIDCFVRLGGFRLPVDSHPFPTSHEAVWRELQGSKAVAHLRTLTMHAHYEALPHLLAALPPALEVLEFAFLRHSGKPGFNWFPAQLADLISQSSVRTLVFTHDDWVAQTRHPVAMHLNLGGCDAGPTLADVAALGACARLPQIEKLVCHLLIHSQSLLAEMAEAVAAERELPSATQIDTISVGTMASDVTPDYLSLFPDCRRLIVAHYDATVITLASWPISVTSTLLEVTILRVHHAHARTIFGQTASPTQIMVSSLAAAGLSALARLTLQGCGTREQRDGAVLEPMCRSMPSLVELALRHIAIKDPECFTYCPKLQTLKELAWPYTRLDVSLATIFPSLTFMHVGEASCKTPVAWATTLQSISTLRGVKWAFHKKLHPRDIVQHFLVLDAARLRAAAERQRLDAEQATAMAERLAAKAAAVAAIAPPEQADAGWFRGSLEIKMETAEDVSNRIRRTHEAQVLADAMAPAPLSGSASAPTWTASPAAPSTSSRGRKATSRATPKRHGKLNVPVVDPVDDQLARLIGELVHSFVSSPSSLAELEALPQSVHVIPLSFVGPAWVTPDIGSRTGDSVAFDTLGCFPNLSRLVNMKAWGIRQIIGWASPGGDFVTGVQFVYGPPDRYSDDQDLDGHHDFATSVLRMAGSTATLRSSVRLGMNEFIHRVLFRVSDSASSLNLITSTGRQFFIGRSDARGTTYEIISSDNTEFIGLEGWTGPSLSQIKCTFAPLDRVLCRGACAFPCHCRENEDDSDSD